MLDKVGERVTTELKMMMSERSKYSEMKDNDSEAPPVVHHKAMPKENLVHDKSSGIIYIKGKLLGKGGFANCYELIDTQTNIMYAGKVIPKDRVSKPHQMAKMAREIELHKSLSHKNIVQFHRSFEDNDNVYIVLEYCGRKSLVHVLKCRKVLSEPEVRYYLRQLVEGCKYVHEKNIIHRDLKLGNMLLCDKMQMKIADFGLATKVNYLGDKKMTVCGTPNYIAPEVLQKRGHSFEADTWALGCIMYAMLVGCPPFETPTLKETYLRIATNRFFIPSCVSQPARALMKRILAPTPEARPTLDEILEDDFFYCGYLPTVLSTSCCTQAPKFPVTAAPLRRPSKPKAGITKIVKETTFADDVTEQHVVKDTNYQMKAPVAETKIIVRPKAFPSPPQTESGNGRSNDSGVDSRQGSPTDHEAGSDLTAGANNAQNQNGASPPMRPPVPPRQTNSSHHHQYLATQQPSKLPDDSSQGLASKLCHRISQCLKCLEGTEPTTMNPPIINPSYITQYGSCIVKWVDYSNKYGFGFQLTNRAVGVLFNDTTRIALSADGRMAEYIDLSQQSTTFHVESPPPKLQKRSTLLTYFATYMDENLIQGGDINPNQSNIVDMPSRIYLKKWFRTSKAIVMYLSDGTLQVNFFEDHTKIILALIHLRYYLTFIDENRKTNSFTLDSIAVEGCTECLQERLLYARNMLQNLIDIEGDNI